MILDDEIMSPWGKGEEREAESLITLLHEKTCSTRVTYFLDGRKVLLKLYEEMVSYLYSKHIADIPKLCVIPGKLRNAAVCLAFTGSLTSFSAKPGSAEVTVPEIPQFSLYRVAAE